MGKTPFFSVLVPTFNHAGCIAAALDSLLDQTDPDWEAVVVDHGSTDDSASIVASRAQLDSRIRLLSQADRGTAEALNAGLHESRGEWVCWLSPDGLFDSRKLEIHRQWICRNPEHHFFHSHFGYLDTATGEVSDPALLRELPGQEWHLIDMLAGASVHRNSICVARGVLQESGGFDTRLHHAEDYDMWLRLLTRHSAVFIPERTCVTRINPDQGTQTFARAGYYDSARAAINFLNAHALPEFFPSLDFQEPVLVEAAIRRTLNVAGNPEALVYALGVHPLLLLRVLEWIDLHANGATKRRLRQLVLKQCDKAHGRGDSSALGFIGKALSAAIRRSGTAFAYQRLSADAIASRQLSALCRAGDPEAELLLRYLGHTCDDLQPLFVGDLSEDLREVVFVCQRGVRLPVQVAYGAFHAMVEVARYTQRAGCRVLVVALSDVAFGFVDGLPFVGARDERALAHLLHGFHVMDAVVAVSRADVLAIAAARRRIIYQHDPCAPFGADPVRDLSIASVQVACVSEFSRTQLAGLGIPHNLLKVVWNGYDREAFHPDAAVVRVPHSIVLAGTVVHYKGIDVALEALRMIRVRFPDATLSVFGDNLPWSEISDDFEARGLVDEQRRLLWEAVEVAFPGARYYGAVSHSELAAAFCAHDVLVMPSTFGETFGIVSLEAQACGCIPVLPEQGGFPETMLADRTGFLYRPNTAAGLADRVIGLWERDIPTEVQRLQAQTWVAEGFSWDKAGARLLSMLDATSSESRLRLLPRRRVRSGLKACVHTGVLCVPRPLRRKIKGLLGLPRQE